MSVLSEYPDAINNKDLQIWNNSAFDDDGETERLFSSCNQNKSPSGLMNKPAVVNNMCLESLDSSFSSKENQSPVGCLNMNLKSSVLVRPLHESKSVNSLNKIGLVNGVEDGEKTDEEMEIENEIRRLYARLEAIRRERAEKNVAKCVEKQGKSVSVKVLDGEKKKESGVKKIPNKMQRRGVSLGPNEIMSAATNLRAKQSGVTPVQSTQNRRKSCFWKLDDIEEEKGFSRMKNGNVRQAVTTAGLKKGVTKGDLVLGSVQPKKLFGEQSVPAKRPVKPGRVIPSRYNQATVTSSMKKRSSSSFIDNVERKPRGGTEGRVKKKWEIPSAIVIPNRLNLDENEDEDVSEGCVDDADVVMPEVVLPRIRVVRYVEEAGRDSGPAKRVAELVGKKSYFDEEAVCQQLSFDED